MVDVGAQVYYIWYGAWGNLNNNGTANRPTTVKVLTDMAQSMGGKPWYGPSNFLKEISLRTLQHAFLDIMDGQNGTSRPLSTPWQWHTLLVWAETPVPLFWAPKQGASIGAMPGVTQAQLDLDLHARLSYTAFPACVTCHAIASQVFLQGLPLASDHAWS